MHAPAHSSVALLDDKPVDTSGGGVHHGTCRPNASIPAVRHVLNLLLGDLQLHGHEPFQLHECPLLLEVVLMRLLHDLLLFAEIPALLVQAADFCRVLICQGLMVFGVALLFPEAAGLPVCTLQLSVGIAELHIQLMVVLLRLEDLGLQLLDFARDLAELAVHCGLCLVVDALLLHVLGLYLLEILPHGTQRLDLWGQLVLLLLELRVDLRDDGGDFVQGLALGLVHLGLLHRGLLQHGLRLPQAYRRRVLGLQHLLSSE
mmetsp:Transcript_80469/g.260742  ORF Transcript_80469/g.260742 Transcript_80469/m.260742 type:complete len:260 (+) Transcript_80469:68-847(+)